MRLIAHIDGTDDNIRSQLDNIEKGRYYNCKIYTNKKEIIPDRMDARFINELRNLKLIFETSTGILILFGNLFCQYHDPFGASFKCYKILQDITEFKNVKGVDVEIEFVSKLENSTRNDELKDILRTIAYDSKFEYNFSQFDEFMDLFNYYKSLSEKLNNNFTFNIDNISQPYFIAPLNLFSNDKQYKKEIKDNNGVLLGYVLDVLEMNQYENEVRQASQYVLDITINGGKKELLQLRKSGLDNLYLSKYNELNDSRIKYAIPLKIINMVEKNNQIIITAEIDTNPEKFDGEYSFLNIYDVGQKIKVDSIENSLRLIKQGSSGPASRLLEYLIGDTKIPAGRKTRTPNQTQEKYMEGLNESQRNAFMMCIDGSPVSLIKGPPGTGKTHVINAIVQYITKALGQRVIISSQTHIAIDNVLDKLMENYDLIIPKRITNKKNKYSELAIDTTLYNTWGKKFFEHNKRASSKTLSNNIEQQMLKFNGDKRFCFSLESLDSEYSVIGATTTTSAIAGTKGLEVLDGYEWLIIDEVSKCPITEVLRYLPYIKNIIMVGDDFQLAPLLEFTKDDVKEFDIYDEDKFNKLEAIYEHSVFSKVMDKAIAANRVVLLNENYRSVKDVLQVYNTFYDGKLIGRREDINPNKVHFKNENKYKDYDDNDVLFVDVFGGQEAKDGTSRYNIEEIKATEKILNELIESVENPSNVTVSAIFPYAAQISRFQKGHTELINKAKKTFKSFEIATVDAFQGRETDIVLVNTVVTDVTQKNFLSDFRRINVSMSRAKDKLIIFGNSITLSKLNMKNALGQERRYFKDIIEYIKAYCKIIKFIGGELEHEDKGKNSFGII